MPFQLYDTVEPSTVIVIVELSIPLKLSDNATVIVGVESFVYPLLTGFSFDALGADISIVKLHEYVAIAFPALSDASRSTFIT